MKVLLLLALVLVLVHSSPDFKSRAARAAAAADDEAVLLCNMTRGGLEACKPSVRSGSSDPAADPSKECCAALAGPTCRASARTATPSCSVLGHRPRPRPAAPRQVQPHRAPWLLTIHIL
uniref:Bifunctional inhibitor/plant lipid transfer protein/seed storage helical domain-containing protein n=1 Tax=Ananas comosus var. bracteatus TaxID=296719 RepID=A0A6V7Q034_ANACO|nr:unnamed protein product [Ananas comosus var. bracteatus]